MDLSPPLPLPLLLLRLVHWPLLLQYCGCWCHHHYRRSIDSMSLCYYGCCCCWCYYCCWQCCRRSPLHRRKRIVIGAQFLRRLCKRGSDRHYCARDWFFFFYPVDGLWIVVRKLIILYLSSFLQLTLYLNKFNNNLFSILLIYTTAGNEFTGSIPSEVGSLNELTSLNLCKWIAVLYGIIQTWQLFSFLCHYHVF